MILSRTIARRRIALRKRPTFWGAWNLVFADALILAGIITLLVTRFRARMEVSEFEPATWMMIISLVLFIFIPSQVVLILSSLWAAKSRAVYDAEDMANAAKET